MPHSERTPAGRNYPSTPGHPNPARRKPKISEAIARPNVRFDGGPAPMNMTGKPPMPGKEFGMGMMGTGRQGKGMGAEMGKQTVGQAQQMPMMNKPRYARGTKKISSSLKEKH